MPRGRPSRATVYARLEHAMAELNERFGGLPTPAEAGYVWDDIWHLDAHHSTALEGNTLVPREVAALLDRGVAVGDKSLAEYAEVKGYGDAARWVYQHGLDAGDRRHGELLIVSEVREIHHHVMSPVWAVAPHPDATGSEGPGSFRQHEIARFSGGMKPPPYPLVAAQLDGWLVEVNALRSPDADMPLPERMARVHNEFERIHPFIDGNGRTGRLVLNLVLVRLGYPPVIIQKRQRPAYLSAMQSADRGEYGPLGELIARSVHDNINRFVLPSVAGPARMVPLAALVDDDLSLVALRAAARRGRLEAMTDAQGGWLSSRKAVEAYKASRHAKPSSS